MSSKILKDIFKEPCDIGRSITHTSKEGNTCTEYIYYSSIDDEHKKTGIPRMNILMDMLCCTGGKDYFFPFIRVIDKECEDDFDAPDEYESNK